MTTEREFVYKALAMSEAVPAIITALAPAGSMRPTPRCWCRRLRGELAFSRYDETTGSGDDDEKMIWEGSACARCESSVDYIERMETLHHHLAVGSSARFNYNLLAMSSSPRSDPLTAGHYRQRDFGLRRPHLD